MKTLIKSKPFVLITLPLLIFITAVIIIAMVNLGQTKEIEIVVTPASATIKIDGKSYENGTYKFKEGTYQVHLEKENFVSKDFSFNTNDTDRIYEYLEQADGTYSWYLNHETDALLLTKIGSFNADIEAQEFTKSYNAISKLPIIYANYDDQYNYTEYRIDGGKFSECVADFCLKITDTTGGNYEVAKQKMKEQGINPDNYEIVYTYTPITPLE